MSCIARHSRASRARSVELETRGDADPVNACGDVLALVGALLEGRDG